MPVSAVAPAILTLVLAAVPVAAAVADSYPSRTIRWIVPFRGGNLDTLSRAVAQQLAQGLEQPVVVENRPELTGIAGMETTAKARPDGYTIATGGLAQLVLARFVRPQLPYAPRQDFTPITLMARSPIALFVNASVPVRTLKDLIDHAKKRPAALVYGSVGDGSVGHLTMELLKQRTGLRAVHRAAHDSVLKELVAGRIHVAFYPPNGQALQQVSEGRLRVVALVSERRFASMPGVPTFAEAGLPGFDVSGWLGAVGPAGLPREVVDRLRREIVRAVESPVVASLYQEASLVPAVSTPEQFRGLIERDLELWGPLIRKLGIRPGS